MKPIHRLAITALLAAVTLAAQTITGVITGTVHDKSGSPVVQARTVLTNDATGQTREARPDGAGDFVFLSVLPGRYTVTVESEGFKKSETKG